MSNEILTMESQFRMAATKADISGNGDGYLDKEELMVFAKEAVKSGNRSNIEEIIDHFGEQTDDLKVFMTKVKDLELAEKNLKQAKDELKELNTERPNATFGDYVARAAISGMVGSLCGGIGGALLSGLTAGSSLGPVGMIAGALVGAGIGIYNAYSSTKEQQEEYDKATQNDVNSYEEIIPELEKIVAEKTQALNE